MVQRLLQYLIKGKNEYQLCDQVKYSDKSKTFMGKIMTKYDLGRERKRNGIFCPKKINSVKPVSFQMALLDGCDMKDLSFKEKRDLNWESEDLGSCLAFTVQLLRDYGQIIEHHF